MQNYVSEQVLYCCEDVVRDAFVGQVYKRHGQHGNDEAVCKRVDEI